jgi:hypothetical protein
MVLKFGGPDESIIWDTDALLMYNFDKFVDYPPPSLYVRVYVNFQELL